MTHDDLAVPESVDDAVAADPRFKAAKAQFREAIARLLAGHLADDDREAVLNAEEAAHAAIAAATDAAWRLGRVSRPGASS